MNIGWLWFDYEPDRPLGDRLEEVAQRYEAKFGERPDLCMVHPVQLLAGTPSVSGLTIKTSNNLLPHHFWMGRA